MLYVPIYVNVLVEEIVVINKFNPSYLLRVTGDQRHRSALHAIPETSLFHAFLSDHDLDIDQIRSHQIETRATIEVALFG